MADYFFPTVVQQTIPNTDMTPLERLVLTHMFDSELNANGFYFFAEDGPRELVHLPTAELKAALAASASAPSSLRDYVTARIANLAPTATEAQIDLSAASWEFFFQDIVRRSRTLHYLTAVSSFTCSKMRPDGFGGSATLITADAVKGKSTTDILEDFIAEMEDGDPAPA
jgi:hypothetical protein